MTHGTEADGGDVVAADNAVVVQAVAGSNSTSLVIPRIVLVIGATVTHLSRWTLDARVRIRAGRRLSSWTTATVRIGVDQSRGG